MNIRDLLWHRLLRRPYKLKLRDVGEGRPVVLLHGLGASGEVWRPLEKVLLADGGWRVLTPDLLGFGDSPRPMWNKYTIAEHARALEATLLTLPQPVVLVGHSMGCLVASHVSARGRLSVARQILYEPPLFADVPEYKLHKRRRDKYFALFEYLAAHPHLLFLQNKFIRRIARRMAGIRISESRWVPFERSLRNAIMEQQAYDELNATTTPTDIIHGRLDFIVTHAEVKDMFADNPHIAQHSVNHMHTVTARAARFIHALLS